MTSNKNNVADDFLAATREFLDLPADPAARQIRYAELQAKWRGLFCRLLAAVETGNPEVWFALGHGYSHGWGTEHDPVQAEAWFRRAADAGHTDAMVHLAMHLGGPAGGNNLVESIRWLKDAASMGNASAMVHLGFAYREGLGVNLDPEVAVNWLVKAFEAGQDDSAVYVGRVFARYLARHEDALSWFHKAAAKGCSESFLELAMLYDDASKGHYDPAEAVKWYHVSLSVSSHVPRSLLALACHYADGVGVPQNNGIARLLLKRLLSNQLHAGEFRRKGEVLLRKIELNEAAPVLPHPEALTDAFDDKAIPYE